MEINKFWLRWFKPKTCLKCGIELTKESTCYTALLIIPNGTCNSFGRPGADFIENARVCFHCKNINEYGEQCC